MKQTKKSFSEVFETPEFGSDELLFFLNTNGIKTLVVKKFLNLIFVLTKSNLSMIQELNRISQFTFFTIITN